MRVLSVVEDLDFLASEDISKAIKNADIYCDLGCGGDEITNASIGDEIEMGWVIADLTHLYEGVDLSDDKTREAAGVWTRWDFWAALKGW